MIPWIALAQGVFFLFLCPQFCEFGGVAIIGKKT
jgi:hypothetical protein